MCPFYARLRHIFGNKLSKSESAEDKTSTDSIKELEFDAFLAALDVNIIEPKLDLESPDFEELTLESTTITNHYLSNINNDLDDKYAERILDDYNSPPASTATNLKSSNSRGQISAVEDVDILRKARLHLESEKLEFERYKFDKMLELKKLEMDRNYELRKLKLEQEERFINLKRKYHDIFDTS
ncbi:uncharacterized protein LOC115625686 isoform X2 [Scaptodrosophila lebanonensis]|nr:uncharacterized protein LOC115625686 isoform X2 [Scaptodrosophila lebanonensis]